jgi:hypothetical protein
MTDYSLQTKFDASETKRSDPAQSEDAYRLIAMAGDADAKNIQMQKVATLVDYLYRPAQDSGDYVTIREDCGFCPGLIDNHQDFIPLFSLVEVFDEVLDYDRVLEEFPGLTYSQINGAMLFLKKISQFNTAGVDISQYIEDEFTQHDELIEELREALRNQEVARVLNFN